MVPTMLRSVGSDMQITAHGQIVRSNYFGHLRHARIYHTTLFGRFMVDSPAGRFTKTGESTNLRFRRNDQTYFIDTETERALRLTRPLTLNTVLFPRSGRKPLPAPWYSPYSVVQTDSITFDWGYIDLVVSPEYHVVGRSPWSVKRPAGESTMYP